MKWGISSSYSSVSHWQKRSKPAASSGPENASISAAMRSRSCHSRSSLPSAYTARYIGSTGRMVTKSAMSAPAAAKVSSSRPGIVSTVGPLSST